MSKDSKTKTLETVETEKKVETEKNVNVKDTETKKVEKIKLDPKMGVARFLQLNPQIFIIESLLKSKYAQSIMTESEWSKTLSDLMNKKITE